MSTPARQSLHRSRHAHLIAPTPGLAPRRLALAVAAAVGLGVLLPPAAQALSFGTARLNSALGQPLDLRIPLLGDDLADLGPQCVRLLPASDSDLPTLNVGRVTIERDGLLTAIRVLGLEPMNEPALRVVIEAGCQRRMQREYVLLIDPPAMRAEAPAAAEPLLPAGSLELGPAEIRAMRGRPLLIRVPLRGPEAPRLAADCVRTVNDGGSPPALESARARLVNVGSASPVLEITTREALSDRTVRVITELGCERPIRREFDLLVETPPPVAESEPATTAAAPAVAAPASAPRRPPAERAVRPRPPAAPVVPAVPPVATAPASAAAPTPAPAAGAPAAAPEPAAQARPAPKDRLVLSVPEDATPPAAVAPAPLQTEEFVRKLDELATEVKRLRAELDAANQRNAQLSEQLARGNNVNLGWAVAAGASLLLAALLWLSGRRSKPQPAPRAEGLDAEGPMTRIVGQRSRAQRAEAAAPAAAAAPIIAGAAGGTLMTGPLSDVHSQGHSIQVTEMGDEEAIRELYADFVTRQDAGPVTARADLAARHTLRLDEHTRHEPGTRFGDDVPATRMTVPLTTQLAVDIDLTPDASTQMKTGEAPSLTQAPTRPLELDLELHLPGPTPESEKSAAKERKDG